MRVLCHLVTSKLFACLSHLAAGQLTQFECYWRGVHGTLIKRIMESGSLTSNVDESNKDTDNDENEKSFRCPVCAKSCYSDTSMWQHVNIDHLKMNISITGHFERSWL